MPDKTRIYLPEQKVARGKAGYHDPQDRITVVKRTEPGFSNGDPDADMSGERAVTTGGTSDTATSKAKSGK